MLKKVLIFGFNWATSSQKWIVQHVQRIFLKYISSFNWATSSQKWIDVLLTVTVLPLARFQLGHFFSEMDRQTRRNLIMESDKFQLGHFFSEMDRENIRIGAAGGYWGFNWATSSQKWIGQ